MHILAFFLLAVHIETVFPCCWWVFPEDAPEECCEEKRVGGQLYNWVGMEKIAKTPEFNCSSDCVYTRVDETDSRYCFKLGGNLTADCHIELVDWDDGTYHLHRCVTPGTDVEFYWPSEKCYHIHEVADGTNDACNVESTCVNNRYMFTTSKIGNYNFKSCSIGSHSLKEREATIIVSNNCTCASVTDADQQYETSISIIKKDLQKFAKDGSTTIPDLMNYLRKMSLVIMDPYQAEALLNSKPCSPARIECDQCFEALDMALFNCVQKYDSACTTHIESTNMTCTACFCQLNKPCTPNAKCSREKPEVAIEEKSPIVGVLTDSDKITHPENKQSCDRPCLNSQPMKCVFNFTLEMLYSDADGRRMDGRNRTVLAYNGQIPGPPIVICEEDELVVNLENKIYENMTNIDGSTSTTTLHFHGIREHTKPWRDGVPWVTQCPIIPGHNFTYGFIAEDFDGAPTGSYTQSGTFWYHSHVGAQRTNGAYGALIIRPKKTEPEIQFDVDDSNNTLILQEWYESSTNQTITSLLINGTGIFDTDNSTTEATTTTTAQTTTTKPKYPVYNIHQPGKRHLFRIIGAISQNVPLQLSIEDHTFTAIALDSKDVEPVHNLTDLWIAGGERFNIVVETRTNYTQYMAYKIKVFGYSNINSKTGPLCTVAWMKYPGQIVDNNYRTDIGCTGFLSLPVDRRTLNPVPNNDNEWKKSLSFPQWRDNATIGNIFIKDMRSKIKKEKITLNLFSSNIYSTMLSTDYIEFVGNTFNNISMIYPGVPFILQDKSSKNDSCGSVCKPIVQPALHFGEGQYLKEDCTRKVPGPCTREKPCHCQHVLKHVYAPGYWIETILINNDVSAEAHPIHQHGGWFWVVGMDKFEHNINRTYIKNKDTNCMARNNCLNRNFDLPPAKDTIQVPPGGYVILRTPLDNKGTWLIHCHINKHVLQGMSMVLQVGGFNYERHLAQDWCTGPLDKDKACGTSPPSPGEGPGSIQWMYDMYPVERCVKPGGEITFNVADGHNVNKVSAKVYGDCTISNSTNGEGEYVWTAPSDSKDQTHYFVCGAANGAHCSHGMKAKIIVSKKVCL